jgi:hypothetical protein
MRLQELITEKQQGSWKRSTKSHKRDPDVWVAEKSDPRKNLEKVRHMYGMQLVDDFLDVLELPNAEGDTDKEMSMFSKDNR